MMLNLRCRIMQRRGGGGGGRAWRSLTTDSFKELQLSERPCGSGLFHVDPGVLDSVLALRVGHFIMYIIRVKPISTEGHISIVVALQGLTCRNFTGSQYLSEIFGYICVWISLALTNT